MKYLLALILFFGSLPVFAQINTGCVVHPTEPLQIDCQLIASEQPIGVGVLPKGWVRFTNNTGEYLQVDEVNAITNETALWGEYCTYIDHWLTGQDAAGFGEVGCTSKKIGELYGPIKYGNGTGLSVAPGSIFQASASTGEQGTNHTFSLKVRKQTTGVHSWRQPQIDQVIHCNGQTQATVWAPWKNTTGHDLHFISAQIYSESANAGSPNTLNGPACFYTFKANGSPKWSSCDDTLRTRGDKAFQMQVIADGEYLAGQGTNACPSGAVWGWAAFMHIW
jgi:hypothetical protein